MCTTPKVEKMSVIKFALPQIVEVEVVPEEEKGHYWLEDEDYERFTTEAKKTRSLWEKHQAGKIKKKFDEAKYSVRGLENLVGGRNIARGLRTLHVRSVLEEIQRQKRTGHEVDWELVRKTSTSLSREAVQRATELAKADEEEQQKVGTEEEERPPLRRKNENFGRKRSGSFLRLLAGVKKKQCERQ
jgi:hypothetical protein